MPHPSDAVLTVRQMQAAEQALIDTGSSVDELMLRAGLGAAEWVWRLAAGRAATVLCGPCWSLPLAPTTLASLVVVASTRLNVARRTERALGVGG